jgi:hypothetical protein
MVTTLRTSTPKARKVHICRSCGQPAAQPGEVYHRATLLYDGHVYDWIECEPCRTINGSVWEWAGMPDEGIGMDDYAEWARDHRDDETWGDEARAYLDRLNDGIRG